MKSTVNQFLNFYLYYCEKCANTDCFFNRLISIVLYILLKQNYFLNELILELIPYLGVNPKMNHVN